MIRNCVIKGVHKYKIRPPLNLNLLVEKEYDNIKDAQACLIWLPDPEDLTEDQLNSIYNPAKRLTLKDVAGLPVGHVPRGLAGALRQILDIPGCTVYCIATGEPQNSFPPWPALKEEGGGRVVPCDFIVEVTVPQNVTKCQRLLQKDLDRMDERDVIVIDIL